MFIVKGAAGKFRTFDAAVTKAYSWIDGKKGVCPVVSIYDDERNVTVAVVTDDANGRTVHRTAPDFPGSELTVE